MKKIDFFDALAKIISCSEYRGGKSCNRDCVAFMLTKYAFREISTRNFDEFDYYAACKKALT